jgi:hypothetical protein
MESKRQLMDSALKDARRRAEDIARATGLRIVSVYAVSPVPFGDLSSSILGSGERFGRALDFPQGRQAFEIRLPELELESSANVIFTVEKP